MTTITINERTKAGKLVLELVKILTSAGSKGVVIETGLNNPVTTKKTYPVSKNIPNTETEKAINDAKKGIGLTKVKNSKDFFKQMGI